MPTLPFIVGILLPDLFSLLLPLEQALLSPAEVVFSVSSVTLGVTALLISAPVASEPFPLLLFVLLAFPFLFCSPSSFCLGLQLFCTTVLLSLGSIQPLSISF